MRIYDNAHVLEASSVRNAASNLSYPFDIYTTSTFRGDRRAFDQTTISKLGGNAKRIVMAIDTVHRHLYIARGERVPLSESEITATVSAFVTHFSSGDYTGATVAAIERLQRSLETGETGFLSAVFPALFLLSLLLLVAVGGFGLLRRHRFGAPAFLSYQLPLPLPQSGLCTAAPGQASLDRWCSGGRQTGESDRQKG